MLGGCDGAVEHTGPRLARPMVKAEIMSRMGEQHLFRLLKEEAHCELFTVVDSFTRPCRQRL